MNYLPKDATIEQACAWLQAETGQTWILPRLMECHLTPYFWLDYKPGYPRLFGDRLEGYQTRMVFQGDLTRLESDGGVALVTMFTAHDDTLVKVEPGWPVPLSELRFKREAVERVAEIINRTKAAKTEPQAATPPVPVVEAPACEVRPAATGPQFTMTKAAMIEQHKHEWPTIERDIADAKRNGLSDAAKVGARGWREGDAMEWARANNKLERTDNPGNQLAGKSSIFNLPTSIKHALKG